MSVKERRRLELMARVRDGELTVAKASKLLGVSVRQGWRLWRRYQKDGDAGLVHGLRGKISNHAIKASVREAVLRLYRQKVRRLRPDAGMRAVGKGRAPGGGEDAMWG